MDKAVDWGKTTFEGVRREQVRRALMLSPRERLEALYDLERLGNFLRNAPRKNQAAGESSTDNRRSA
ncbi:MAG: hypothetical protein LBP94_02435 [Zoogloeaceae bacterium]|jgi:hypothetical protein|nr:hypothetical protein [Zoogloeaceae bacterium]